MANMSNYLENKLIDFLLRGQSFTAPSTIYFALCTANPTDASTGSTITEASGGNYARQSLACTASNFLSTQGNTSTPSNGTNGTTSNNTTIAWSNVTWSGTITAIALCDASSGGNLLWYATLSSSKIINSGDSVSFAIGDLLLQIDN